MKSSENLRLIVRLQRVRHEIYRILEESSTRRSQARILQPHATKQVNPTHARAHSRMNPLSWTVDDWYWYGQWASAFFVAVTILTGRVSNKRQSVEILTLKGEALKAQAKLLETERLIREPRFLESGATIPLLENGPKGEVVINCSGTAEARGCAMQLQHFLIFSGWKTTLISSGPPIPAGITIFSDGEVDASNPKKRVDLTEPAKTLYKALLSAGPRKGLVMYHMLSDLKGKPVEVQVGPKF